VQHVDLGEDLRVLIALTGQYFVADNSIARRIAASDRPVPRTMCSTSISVKTCGYSSRWLPVASTS